MDKKYSYQPDFATSVICWSFTFMLFLLSMLLWLEIIVLQPWTVITLILFMLVFALQVKLRNLELGKNVLRVNKVIKTNNVEILYSDVVAVEVKQHRLILKTKHHNYEWLMKKQEALELAQIISQNISVE